MDDIQPLAYACLAVLVAVYAVRWYANPLRAIPTIGGSSLPGLSYISAFRNIGDIRAVLEEGYRKYPESAFKLSMWDQWLVVVSGRDMVEDFRKRHDDELSASLGMGETIQGQHCIHPAILTDDYVLELVREKLTRTLPTILPDVVDEVDLAVRDHITTKENEWTSIEVMLALQKIIARASSRAFIGLPLCRNERYLALAIDFAVHVVKGGLALRLLPGFIRPIMGPLFSRAEHDTNLAVQHLRPLIEDRMKASEELGEGWNDKPVSDRGQPAPQALNDSLQNDLLQLILDRAIPRGESLFVIAQRVLMLNLAAIHTSSSTIGKVMYYLAEHPELVQALREEIQAIVSSDGWTSLALGKMWKLDSVLRETLRCRGTTFTTMARKAVKDVTLRDGTRIPKGTLVAANAYGHHHDGALLEDADKFDPFRYARMRQSKDQELKHQFTSTSLEYIPFGHGNHACPGRYFASNELKAVLGQIILNYDVKIPGDGSSPPDVYFVAAVLPAPHGRVLFKKRAA